MVVEVGNRNESVWTLARRSPGHPGGVPRPNKVKGPGAVNHDTGKPGPERGLEKKKKSTLN